jgi:DNA replication protein DnaC
LAIDEVGYPTYHPYAADPLFDVINHRQGRNSILSATNRAFKD